ncbi:hypothetical protein QUB33_07410 [Microcoleus sp. B3-A4]|uniref:hypothetical protein n=1 Tax=Microcoleus sp. B3-A4 TaxID=2818653 RepID=UPI002FD07245
MPFVRVRKYASKKTRFLSAIVDLPIPLLFQALDRNLGIFRQVRAIASSGLKPVRKWPSNPYRNWITADKINPSIFTPTNRRTFPKNIPPPQNPQTATILSIIISCRAK